MLDSGVDCRDGHVDHVGGSGLAGLLWRVLTYGSDLGHRSRTVMIHRRKCRPPIVRAITVIDVTSIEIIDVGGV